ncbi:MAG: polysaccharide pyruvyl transferase family protein [Pseudomonadota bacterium]
MRIYLAGQSNFGNRGCEALVRSTAQVIRERLGPVEFLVPSLDSLLDERQWPEAAMHGIRFVSSPPTPWLFLQWSRLCTRLPFLTQLPWPNYRERPDLRRDLESCDVLLSIGGDSYCLDYGLDSLFYFAAMAELGLRLGKPVMLWGASVGPFSELPGVEKQMIAHLGRLSSLTIRESHSMAYLREIGLPDRIVAVVDSAFALVPQEVDVADFWPMVREGGVLGLNVSPLIEQLQARRGKGNQMIDEVAGFLRKAVTQHGLAVLLVPHVDPLEGGTRNSDSATMSRLLTQTGDLDNRVRMVPPGMNATQLKSIISRCRYFIGARTHATIAALSTGVPTISIAYSPKARGINRDLFGHERYVLEAHELSAETLADRLQLLLREETQIVALLTERIPEWRCRAYGGAEALQRLLSTQAATTGREVAA